jgi:hypothetical protein
VAAVRDLKSFIIFQKGGCSPSQLGCACRHIGGGAGVNPEMTQADADILPTAGDSGDNEAFGFVSPDPVNLFISPYLFVCSLLNDVVSNSRLCSKGGHTELWNSVWKLGVHPASFPVGTGGSFPGGKAAGA